MRTLINANQLRDKITERWVEGRINKADMDEVFSLIDELRIGIEDLWIPVTEYLPRTEDPVWGSFLGDDGIAWVDFAWYDQGKHVWYETIHGEELDSTTHVKAWMYIPKTYREGDKG